LGSFSKKEVGRKGVRKGTDITKVMIDGESNIKIFQSTIDSDASGDWQLRTLTNRRPPWPATLLL
jgi:hypothetical protein